VEVLTCLHPKIFIQSIGNKFLLLVIQILNCYENQILTLIGHRTAGGGAGGGGTNSEKETAIVTGGSSSSSLMNLSVDDLMLALQDILFVSSWLQETLIPLAEDKIFSTPLLSMPGSALTAQSPVRNCFLCQVTRLKKLIPILWNRMASLIVFECRSHLKVSFRLLRQILTNCPLSSPLPLFLDLSLSNLLLGNFG
jgi:hypothetical protein